MVIRKLKVLYFFLFLFFINNPLKGIIAVDFGELPGNITRVVTYNIADQRLLSYEEIDSDRPWTKPIGSYALSYKKIRGNKRHQVSVDSVRLRNNQKLAPLFVRSTGQIVSYISGEFYNYSDNTTVWFSRSIEEKDPQEIERELSPPPSRLHVGASLPITCLGALRTLATFSDDDKGILGELITTLTFLSFGYTEHPSKYEYNHGLDGIFESWSGNHLFLTQSKQIGTSRTAKNVVKHELNEPKIWETLINMEKYPSTQPSAILLRRFLDTKPYNIYKFGHRVANDGQIQYYMTPLEIDKFPKLGIKLTGASQERKIKAIQDTLTTYEKTPEKQLELAVRATFAQGFSRQQITEMVMQVHNENLVPRPRPWLKPPVSRIMGSLADQRRSTAGQSTRERPPPIVEQLARSLTGQQGSTTVQPTRPLVGRRPQPIVEQPARTLTGQQGPTAVQPTRPLAGRRPQPIVEHPARSLPGQQRPITGQPTRPLAGGRPQQRVEQPARSLAGQQGPTTVQPTRPLTRGRPQPTAVRSVLPPRRIQINP